MNLFLLRHGSAEASADKDRNRQLTEEGRADLRAILSESKEALAQVDVVYASPYIRAQQTAEIALAHLEPSKKLAVQTLDSLTPGGNPHAVIEWLAGLSDASVLLVSHQPFIGTVLDGLGGFEPGRYRMGTSALAHLQSEPVAAGFASLKWLRQP